MIFNDNSMKSAMYSTLTYVLPSTRAALKEMIAPGALVIFIPSLTGIFLACNPVADIATAVGDTVGDQFKDMTGLAIATKANE
jgi:Na+/H+-translocating membrane pyrophosphatase